MMVGELVLPDVMDGIMDASTSHKSLTLLTRKSIPTSALASDTIRQVPTQ